MRRKSMILLLLVIGTLGACADSPTEPTGQPTDRSIAAEAALFTAMNKDDYLAAGDIVGELFLLRDEDPLNYRNTFILGAAAFWWIAEAHRPGTNPLVITGQAIPIILQTFVDVLQNDPVNGMGASALLGAFLSDAGFDKVQGNVLVEQAVPTRPEIGLFQRMHIRRFGFADDTITHNSVEAGFQFWENCLGAPINRANPDMTGKVKPPANDAHKGFCWGSARVPHGFEGTWMIFGDLLVKDGQIAAARRAYLNAQLGVNYQRWKYKSELEARLASDLVARYATYASRDNTKWAPIGLPLTGCTQCHASLPTAAAEK